MEREDRLLQGALDLHAHGYPEFTLGMPPRVDNVEWGRLAAAAGMRGFVVKSHLWPTTTTAHMLRALYPELEVFGSITLNPPAGGVDPVSVEIAAQCGARMVWMPTWSARQDPPRPSVFMDRMKPFVKSVDPTLADLDGGLTVLDAAGELTAAARQVVALCAEYGMTLASGHLPIAASLALSREAARAGARFLLTHPLSGSVGATVEDQLAVVAEGGMIEHVFIGCMPMHQRADPQARRGDRSGRRRALRDGQRRHRGLEPARARGAADVHRHHARAGRTGGGGPSDDTRQPGTRARPAGPPRTGRAGATGGTGAR